MVRDPLNQYWTRDVSTRLRVAVMPELGGQGGHWTPQYLADQLTLFQLGGGHIIPTYYYWPPQCFSPSGLTE